ncbi:MAG: MarR family winged helix-turn-helix transcriptional regulator [Candidatus Acetothermia bacterium]
MIIIIIDEGGYNSELNKASLLLYRIAQGINKLIREKGEENDMSATQIQTVVFLSGAHPRNKNVGSIARRLQIAQPTASRVVDSLVGKGLVKRQRDEKDRRRVKLQVTEEGQEVKEEINEISRVIEGAIRELSVNRQEALGRDLIKVAGKLQSQGHLSAALTCRYCRYFERNGGSTKERPHHCKLTGEDLSEEESYLEWVHEESGLNMID